MLWGDLFWLFRLGLIGRQSNRIMNSTAKHQIMKHLLHKGDKNWLAAIAISRKSASKLEKMSDTTPLVIRIKLNSPICGATICMTAPHATLRAIPKEKEAARFWLTSGHHPYVLLPFAPCQSGRLTPYQRQYFHQRAVSKHKH